MRSGEDHVNQALPVVVVDVLHGQAKGCSGTVDLRVDGGEQVLANAVSQLVQLIGIHTVRALNDSRLAPDWDPLQGLKASGSRFPCERQRSRCHSHRPPHTHPRARKPVLHSRQCTP